MNKLYLLILVMFAAHCPSLAAAEQSSSQESQAKTEYRKNIRSNRMLTDLRRAFDAYASGKSSEVLEDSAVHCTDQTNDCLSAFPKEYFRSKFCLLVNQSNPFGGEELVVISQNDNKIFSVWMFPDRGYDPDGWLLRAFSEHPANHNDKIMKKIKVAAGECLRDPALGL